MPEYLSPGVYVDRLTVRRPPIVAVGTTTAGFLGFAQRGPPTPRVISSWSEYQRCFGGHDSGRAYLSFAIEGFFRNGGQRCYVARVVANDAVHAETTVGALHLIANGPGAWGNDLQIEVMGGSADPRQLFRLRVFLGKGARPFEDFDNLTHRVGRTNNAARVINRSSSLIKAWFDDAARPPPRADRQGFRVPGSDGRSAIDPADFAGDPLAMRPGSAPPGAPVEDDVLGAGRGLAALGAIDGIALLAAPDSARLPADGHARVSNALLADCEKRRDRFALINFDQATAAPIHLPDHAEYRESRFAAIYYPWLEVADPHAGAALVVPPVGHVAGMIVRSDVERGVHKAPANVLVQGIGGLARAVSRADQAMLNPQGVNCFRDFGRRGIRLWGARTLAVGSEYRYISVQRLAMLIETSVKQGISWAVFEPNDQPLWSSIVGSVSTFLFELWRNGALQGVQAEEAFFVKCDRATMTQRDIDNGRLILLIGFAAVRPAEFVILRIVQKTGR